MGSLCEDVESALVKGSLLETPTHLVVVVVVVAASSSSWNVFGLSFGSDCTFSSYMLTAMWLEPRRSAHLPRFFLASSSPFPSLHAAAARLRRAGGRARRAGGISGPGAPAGLGPPAGRAGGATDGDRAAVALRAGAASSDGHGGRRVAGTYREPRNWGES